MRRARHAAGPWLRGRSSVFLDERRDERSGCYRSAATFRAFQTDLGAGASRLDRRGPARRMIPPGTKDPKAQGDAAKNQPAAKPDAVQPCASCTVTLNPSPVKICDTTTKKNVTAAGTPAGGSFAWSIDDAKIGTVAGSGKTAKVQGKSPGKTKVKVTYSVSGCSCSAEADVSVCTCTPAPNDGRHYTSAHKGIAGAIGVRAKIKTRYGKVCCEDEGCSKLDSYNVVYANITNTTHTAASTAKMIWAQSGFGRERDAGTTNINKYRYAEMKGGGAAYKVLYDKANPPAEGTVHLYECLLDPASGKWSFSQDGAVWQTFADPAWKNNSSSTIQYTGEIIDQEDDMAGTAADKCAITECQYLLDAGKPTETLRDVLYDFGFDKSNVTPEHQAQLDAIADDVKKSWDTPPEIIKIRLVGHTDAVGSPGYNMGLGQRRALAVRGALADALENNQAGLSQKVQFATQSKGESELIDFTNTPAGDARNRRVQVFITTKAALPKWQDAGLTAAEVNSDDNSEWGAEWVSGTAFNIWDKKPLP